MKVEYVVAALSGAARMKPTSAPGDAALTHSSSWFIQPPPISPVFRLPPRPPAKCESWKVNASTIRGAPGTTS